MKKNKGAFSLFNVVAENFSSNELELKTKIKEQNSKPPQTHNCKCGSELANLIHDINNLGITVSAFNNNFDIEKKAIQDKLFKLMKNH